MGVIDVELLADTCWLVVRLALMEVEGGEVGVMIVYGGGYPLACGGAAPGRHTPGRNTSAIPVRRVDNLIQAPPVLNQYPGVHKALI